MADTLQAARLNLRVFKNSDANELHEIKPQPEPAGQRIRPIKDVVGRAILISWPVNRSTWLDDYPTVFAGANDHRR